MKKNIYRYIGAAIAVLIYLSVFTVPYFAVGSTENKKITPEEQEQNSLSAPDFLLFRYAKQAGHSMRWG